MSNYTPKDVQSYIANISQCDELKPTCTRCELTLQQCCYPTATSSAASKPRDKPSLPSPQQCRIPSLSPKASPSSFSERSPSFETSPRSTPAALEAECYSGAVDAALRLTDTDLYHHYLEHTSRTLSHSQRDQGALQIGIPTLALQSKTVFHSLLALSAVCLCCDMISKTPPPSFDAVNQVLMTGYRHYNLASEQMRGLMSQPDALQVEPLLASALLLVPFTTASQQVNHWISSKDICTRQGSHKILSTTPRDLIVMMRGIKTTLQVLNYDLSTPQEMESTADNSSPLLGFNISAALPPSKMHFMFLIVEATSEQAFCKLQERIASLSSRDLDGSDQLSACTSAFEVLLSIKTEAFSRSDSPSPHSTEPIEKSLEPESASPLQVGQWLRSYTNRHTNLPILTMRCLGFLVQVPQAYLDLVLPLLDQRLESPTITPHEDKWPQLTKYQALALDIYAHWSVLMFLVEEDSWWIGNLPTVTLTGMVNRYGDHFVTRLWPEDSSGQEQWWPGGMLNILRETKRYR